MLKLRSIGINDYRVLEGRQRIGRIRLATDATPQLPWLAQLLPNEGLPMHRVLVWRDREPTISDEVDGIHGR
jgi:hypothetical protein